MTETNAPKTTPELLVQVSKAVGAVKKDGYNSGQNFSFRGIDAVVNACSAELARAGVNVTPEVQTVNYVNITIGRNQTPATSVRLLVDYVFRGPAGDEVRTRVAAEGNDAADKGTAKAMSVALRTALLQTLMLPTDDPDPDASYDEQQPEYAAVRNELFAACDAKGWEQMDLVREFQEQGGKGKVNECEDVALLRRVLDAVKASAG